MIRNMIYITIRLIHLNDLQYDFDFQSNCWNQ